jgi:alkylated DNA repair protein (DNA oxidative demethylase)
MTVLQPDLFGRPDTAGPFGLTYAEDAITPAEEAALIAALDDVTVSPFRFQGWLGKRQTASFGWHYDFDKASFGEAAPIPNFLLPFRDRAGAFAGIAPAEFVQALIVRYDPGAGIGWHRDRPVFDHVVGLSLEAPATLRLRRRTATGFERASIDLAPRSIYHLSGEVRYDWEHSIAPMLVRRWSVTFRSLSDKGRAITGSASA